MRFAACWRILQERYGWGHRRARPQLRNGRFRASRDCDLRDRRALRSAKTRAHRIYFATANNVRLLGRRTIRKRLLQNGVPLRGVDAFYRDPDGMLWMGMLGRRTAAAARTERFRTFLMRDGLFDGEIYGIVADEQERLWMACSKGIFSVSRAELLRFAAGEMKKIASTPYSPTDALRVIECKPGVQPAASRMRDGRMWFSTIRGLIVLDPEHLQRNVPPPPVVIEDVTVNGERESAASIGSLAPGQKNLEFSYTGLSFLAPARLTFRYMLEGYDKDWIDAGTRRRGVLHQPSAGNVSFPRDGLQCRRRLCNEAGSSVAFTLAPHYYQRVWFWPLMRGLAADCRIWLVYQIRIRRLREHYRSDRGGAQPHRAGAARHADSGIFRNHHGDAGAGGATAVRRGARHAARHHSGRRQLACGKPRRIAWRDCAAAALGSGLGVDRSRPRARSPKPRTSA